MTGDINVLLEAKNSFQKEAINQDQIDEEVVGSNENEEQKAIDDSTANLCGVCYANPPDSVYMECGHGGICYECAIDIWKSSDECYLCRKVRFQGLANLIGYKSDPLD